jgi:hypothetical protein|tara:strand:+ start:77 stop:688 length:612 start_codon:yes stop_codon:yes gene_type:complete
MNNRNIDWLVKHRIVFKRDPITDIPTIETHQYKYYENGTYECYHLFNSKAKITTYKSLKWHFFVLYYLNMDNIINSDFVTLSRFIANKDNGFVTFFIKNKLLEDIIRDVLQQGGEPPKNKLRKIIFKMSTGLSTREKLSIVGKLIGRSKVSQEDIYNTMICMSDSEKITISKLAKTLKCSTRTIHRRMSNDLKLEKERLNEEI